MKIAKILVCFCFVFMLTGCFDKVELEERGLVLAIGIDKYDKAKDTQTEKTGEEKRFIVSIAMPEISEAEKEKNENNNDKKNNKDEETKNSVNEAIKTAEAPSVSSAINLIDTYMSKNLYYGHTKAIVLGKEILEDANLLKEVIDALERDNEISRKIIVLGSNTKAQDILETIPKDEKMVGIYINDFYKNNKKNSGFSYKLDLEDVIQNLLTTNDTVLPSIQIVEGDVRLAGLMVLKNAQLVGYLNDAQTKGILWIIDKKSLGEIDVPFENGYVSTTIFKKKTKEQFYEENNKIVFDFTVNIEGNISEYSLGKNIMVDNEKYKNIETEINKYVETEINNSINIIKDLNVDIIGLKQRIRKDNYNLYKKFDLENKNIYDYIQFNIKCNTTIKGSGSIK